MNFGAWIFGLEINVLSQCSTAEIRKYNFLAYFFCLLILLGGVSFFYFFLLLSGSYFVAIIGAIIMGFVYTSILRFSIITIGVPLHEEATFKRMVINTGNIFRLIVVSFFIFTILVPFVSLLNHNKFTDEVESKKDMFSLRYSESKLKSKEQQLSILNAEIKKQTTERSSLNNKLNSNITELDKGLLVFRLKRIDSTISELNQQIIVKDSSLTAEVKEEITNYNEGLSTTELPFLRLRLTMADGASKSLIIILFIAFISIFPLYISFLAGKRSSYARLVTLDRKQKIIDNYRNTKRETSDFLKKKFNYNCDINEVYEDSPFDTKKIFPSYVKLKDKSLFAHFENLSNE